MNIVRAGVVGVGYLGQYHAEKYTQLPGVELAGVADAERSRASAIAEKLGTRAVADAAGLIGGVDAVSIVTPTVLHHRVAKQFLEAGVHVLLEKPVTVTLDEADELIAIARQRGVILQVGHIERFNPAVAAVRQRLAAPRYIQAERSAPFTVRCTDVNVVLDLMIHDLDIAADLANARPKEVSAAGRAIVTRHIDTATARVLFENGCVADLSASRVSDAKKREMRVFDGEVMYTVDYQAQQATVSRRGPGTVPELAVEKIPVERRDTLFEEVRDFIRCVRENRRPLVSGEEGRSALALAQLITRNLEQGISGFMPVP
jgi:predicted dehydrogenase